MKYVTTALCALLASTAYAQEDVAGTDSSVAEKPTFTVSQYLNIT